MALFMHSFIVTYLFVSFIIIVSVEVIADRGGNCGGGSSSRNTSDSSSTGVTIMVVPMVVKQVGGIWC